MTLDLPLPLGPTIDEKFYNNIDKNIKHLHADDKQHQYTAQATNFISRNHYIWHN